MTRATTLEQQVQEALDLIRPAIQLDGGDIRLESIDGGVVVVALSGTCETCPISPVTLKAGVERMLRERVAGISEVVAIET
jgi:Fe-S cluster biogenesis protein NfuA